MLAKASVVCAMVGLFLLSSITGNCATDCFAVAAHALRVQLVDSISNGTVTAGEVTVIAIDGAFRDSVTTSNVNTPIRLAMERAGTYRVEARATGYQPWIRDNITVTGDECHPKTVDVLVRLQRP
ncbi:MAG: hypothetical protein WEE89_00565 [Gemmatimonadota bacterium]